MKHFYFLLFTFFTFNLSFGQVTELYISKFAEGSSNNKFLEIYNGTDQDIDLSQYSISTCSNGCDVTEEFDYPDNVVFEAGTIIASGDVYVIAHGSADPSIPADQTFTYLSNGDDFMALTLSGATSSSYTIIDALGDMGPDPGNGWSVAGVANGTQNHTLTRKSTVCGPNAVLLSSFGTSTSDSEWIVGDINSGWETVGNYDGCVSGPVLTIIAPSNNQEFQSGTASVTVTFSVANFNVGPINSGADGHIHWSVNGQDQAMKYDLIDESIEVQDGEIFTIYVELVDNNHQPINPSINQTASFTVLLPCDLSIGTITSTCDTTTTASTDTYTTTIDFSGGGTTNYTIDTAQLGSVSGDDPSIVSDGTIIINGVIEGNDFLFTITGDPANSSCEITRSISSPNCTPSLALPYSDTFDYPDGSLTSSSNWNNFSGSEGDLLVTSGQVVVQHGTPSEDASVAFSTVQGSLYYAFDFSVIDPGEIISGNDFEYFAVLKNDANTYRARIDIVAANNSGNDFTVGISSTGGTADIIWLEDLSFDTTYRATVKYDQDLNIAQLWINANAETDASILADDESDPGTSITQFGLRQSDSSQNEGILIDNLVISQTFSETLGIQDNFASNSFFKLYPNPSNIGFVNIKSNQMGAVQAQVFDMLGKQMIDTTVVNERLEVSSLNAGIYIVKLTQNDRTTTKKLILQ
jgi:hypothetical protein